MELPFEQSQRRDNSTTIQQQATKQAVKGRQELARYILAVLPTAVAMLPATEVEAVLNNLPRMT